METCNQNTSKIWIGNATGIDLWNMLAWMAEVIDDAQQLNSENDRAEELASLYSEIERYQIMTRETAALDDATRSAMVGTYLHAYKLVVGEGLLSERFKSLVVTPNN